MAYKNKYQRQKEQSSIDGGATWTDTGETKKGRLLEVASEDCNIVDWREVFGAWFCLKATDLTRWVDSGTTECDGNDKYSIEKEQYSSDGGTTWTDTGQTRQGSLIEYNSPDCTTPSILYRWVNVSGEYVCVGTDKYAKQKQQYSIDGIIWYDVVPANIRQGVLIEPNSLDCGSEDIQYRWVEVIDEYVCVGEDKYGKEKEQYSVDDGVTWTDTGQTRQGSLIEEGSTDCDYNKYKSQYLTFEALEDVTFSFNELYIGNPWPSHNNVQYSIDDGLTWTTLVKDAQTTVITTGNKIIWKQTGLTPIYSDRGGIGIFGSTGRFNAYGNIMSLLYGDDFENKTIISDDYQFSRLFEESQIVSAKNLILPTTTSKYCYEWMFVGCTSLTTAPALPATTLAMDCYSSMFKDCTSLTTAPELPATTLASSCYNYMFGGCTSLTTPPVLPATACGKWCYTAMFSGCTSLTTAPALPATTLGYMAYSSMFYGCTSLTTAPALPATTLAEGCYDSMFYGCTSLTTAPVLSATTLAKSCYGGMFYGCSSLNNITCLATDISASYCTYNWVSGVSQTGTFTKAASMASWTSGESGIPNGWSVVSQ